MRQMYLVRHGVTRANIDVVYAGRTNDELLPLAKPDLESVASLLASREIRTIYVSPQRRAIASAKPLAEYLDVDPIVSSELAEMEMGTWTGLDAKVIAERFPSEWRTWRDDPWNALWPGFEGLRSIEDRVSQWLARVSRERPSGNAVAFTHETIIRVLLARTLGASGQMYRQIVVPNCGISSLILENGGWKVGSVNENFGTVGNT